MSPVLVMLFGLKLLIVVLAAVMLVNVKLSVTGLKQELQEGISWDLRLMKESPRVQWMVEVGRRGKRRMRRMQGRSNRVGISIVGFNARRPDLI